MENFSEQTLASIVTNNHQIVPVLEKYELDFCCKGKRTLAEACMEKGLSIDDVISDIEQVSTEASSTMPYSSMNAEQLINYIVTNHHYYVSKSIPVILGHLEKVAAKHGSHFPEMEEVLQLFSKIAVDFSMHLRKEEVVLFPRIKELYIQLVTSSNGIDSDYILAPVDVMESEHEEAGEAFDKIRQLTGNYSAPAEACTTFRVVMEELRIFEEDLHKHVHLENNVLFPLAKTMLLTIAQAN